MPRHAPVVPDATTGAADLLDLLYDCSGQRLLAGQHNQPVHGSAWTDRITDLTGSVPALWGQEVGFSAPGTLDGIDRREANLAEAVGWYRRGAVVTYTWHSVCPDDDEPVEFVGGIQRELAGEDFDALLDPASALHARWCAQVDVVAGMFGSLRDAGVPVLFRPYHEMNGSWFWWGRQPQRFGALWRMLYHRLTEHHRLNNLVWVWSPNSAYGNAEAFAPYFPGHDVVDVLAMDTYDNHYEREHYDALLDLADGRPIGLGEVGTLPAPAVLDDQPRWCWFMAWPDIVTSANSPAEIRAVYADARVVTLDGAVSG